MHILSWPLSDQVARVGDQPQNISQFWSLNENWRPGHEQDEFCGG
ncbi:hypothetical protein A2U01_0118275, partial [Trifolium medium]|nr:hypothetical protein [Trifolium medium]